MGGIPEKFDTLPIGRQIKRTITGRIESGVVRKQEYRTDCTSTYQVDWETQDNDAFVEKLALTTIQSYYGNSDTYVDEPFVTDDIRLLQKVCSLPYALRQSIKPSLVQIKLVLCSIIGMKVSVQSRTQRLGRRPSASCTGVLAPKSLLPNCLREEKPQVSRTWHQQQPRMLLKQARQISA